MKRLETTGLMERVGTTTDGLRLWLFKAWRMGVLMSKGAYLLAERRRLFVKLGEAAFEKLQKNELAAPDLKPLVHRLEKLTKKVELEEMLIRNLRYGGRERRKEETVN